MELMKESLVAFHVNALHSLQYVMTSNIWFVVIILACITTMILNWKEKKGTVVREEQNIL